MSSNKNSWWGKRLGLLGAAALLFLLAGGLLSGSAAADGGGGAYPLMHPDQETLQEWIEAYDSAPRAHMVAKGAHLPGPTGSLSLLSRLDYIPSERNQGSCNNCWAWAGTGCLGIALDVQQGIKDRLSVQYINSCQSGIIGKTCCAAGWLSDFADFYDPPGGTGHCLPWSNTSAHWQDGDASCDTPCGSISTDPNYPIPSVQDVTIETQTVDQTTAIANIKDVLHQDKAVWFAFFLPDSSAWSDFFTFWYGSSESVVYDIDQFCGTPYAGGGGHAVLCVGYDDEDPHNPYWVMLNSWGTAGGNRPNGLFRVDMDMAYNCVNSGYSFYWQTLDVTFGIPGITVSPTSLDVAVLPDSTENHTLTIGNDGHASLTYSITDGDCPWLDESPKSGTIEPGNWDNITVTVDTTGLAPGWYDAEIVISNNDPARDPTTVPVSLFVQATDIPISGVTGEVNCDVLPGVTVTLYQGAEEKDTTTSDGSGNYALTAPISGTYTVEASKAGFRDQTQAVPIWVDPERVDFQAETGLVPEAAEMSYVLTCVNHWLYPVPPCGLDISSVLAVVNAWLYPLP